MPDWIIASQLAPLSILAVSFLVGSIPFGLLIAKLFHVNDITQHGSGNIGATNVSRVAGFFPAGLLTFLLDLAKGALPVSLLGHAASADLLQHWLGTSVEIGTVFVWATGFFAVLGHCYSPWIHFKGGKGVATGFGVFTALSPLSALVGGITYGLVFWDKRIGSLGSLAGLTAASIAYLVIKPTGPELFVGAAMVFLIFLRHESNIDALLENREKNFR